MSRAKLFNMLQSRGKSEAGRNAFDISNRHVYTSKAARLTPVKGIHTVPKDYFNVHFREFTQNNIPMNTASFIDGIKELSAYYVPYNTIWHNFNQYMATREDPDSVLLQERGISYEPRIGFSTLYGMAFTLFVIKTHASYFHQLTAIQNFADNVLEQPSSSGSGTFYDQILQDLGADATIGQVIDYVNDFYRKNPGDSNISYSSFYTQELDNFLNLEFSPVVEWHNPIGGSLLFENFKYLGCTTFETRNNPAGQKPSVGDVGKDLFGEFRWCEWLQKLDMLGYGNLYPIFYKSLNKISSLFDEHILSKKFTYSNGQVSFSPLDFINYYVAALKKVDDAIETADVYVKDGVAHESYVNVYSLYAYNKVFYDMFRNVYYDLSYNVRNYNVDFLDCNSLEGSIIKSEDIPYRFYSLECHQWRKDMFTGVLPDNQLGDVSELILGGGSASTFELPVTGSISSSGSVTGDAVFNKEATKLFNVSDGKQNREVVEVTNNNAGLSVNSHSVYASPKHYHDVELSNINFDLSANGSLDVGNVALNVLALKRAEALQQYRQDLMRAGNRTRDIFHQIFGASPKSELDESPYFVEAVNNSMNINPIIATADTGSENNGRLGDIAARVTMSGSDLQFEFSTEDFGVLLFLSYVVPESMYNSYRIDPNNTCLTQEAHGLPYFQNLGLQPVIGESLNNLRGSDFRFMTLGYSPSYIEKKTDIDLVHGNLVDMSFDDDEEYQGSLSHWVVARTDMQNQNAVTLRNFYIDPAILDNVFQFNAGDDYETDHFLTYSSLQVDSVRPFSELGLPRFV